MNDYINYYDLLGVSKDCTKEEIRKAYIKQIKKWHPDINKDDAAIDITRKLNDAKEILLDDNKRKEYDKLLDKDINDKYNDLKSKVNKKDNNTYNEEKLYTKWEYFILYLKYYKVSIIRKIFSTILVLIETIICSIFQMINYLVTFVLITFYDLIINGLIITLVIFIGYNLFNYIKYNELFNVIDYVLIILLILIIFTLPNIIKFLINKVSLWISKLNIYLFKIFIGYNRKG